MSQFGNAQAAGSIAQGNAQAGMWNNIGQGLSQFGQMAMYSGMYGGNQWGGGNRTSGNLPTSWGDYMRGGYNTTTYAPHH